MTQTATNDLTRRSFPVYDPAATPPLYYQAAIAQLKRTGTTLRAYADAFDVPLTAAAINLTSAKYPALDATGETVTVVGYEAGRAFFDWVPTTMPAAIVDGSTVDAGNMVVELPLQSQIVFAASHAQIDATPASGVVVIMYGRVHQKSAWLELGNWAEGGDPFPIIVEFQTPLSQVKVVGDSDDFKVFAQR
jgi:hypothetical protein